MIMRDNSLLFFDMLENISWNELRSQIKSLHDAQITGWLTDEITEFWLDFTFRGYRFTINNPMGEFWFFAEDAKCPQEVLDVIINQFTI